MQKTFSILPAVALVAVLGVSRATAQAPVERNPQTIDFRFPGGSLVDYFDMLKAETGAQGLPEFNVVINNVDWARQVGMPPVFLKKVRIDTAIGVVAEVADSTGYSLKISNETAGESGFGNPGGDKQVFDTYVVLLRPLSGPKNLRTPKKPRRLEIFSVGDLLGGEPEGRAAEETAGDGAIRLQTLLTAIETAVEIGRVSDPGQEPSQIKFHSESALLFLLGTEDEIRVVEKIVEQMRTRRAAKEKVREREEAWQQDRNALMLDFERLKMDGAEQRAELTARLQQSRAENIELKAEVAALRKRAADLQDQLKSYAQELEKLRRNDRSGNR